MKVVFQCLKADGLFLLHTIGGNTSVNSTDPWISKYIFPNSMLPSAKQIISAAEGLLVLEDWHSFWQYYDKNLMAWHSNFTKNWNQLKDEYDERFYRMWTYYLLSCAGGFRSRRNQLWQIVFSKKGIKGGYRYRGTSSSDLFAHGSLFKFITPKQAIIHGPLRKTLQYWFLQSDQ